MSHDPHSHGDPSAAQSDDATNPALKDAKLILLIVVASIAIFAGIVYFFVL